MDENTFEFVIGFLLLMLLFLGFYGVTRFVVWLNMIFEARKK